MNHYFHIGSISIKKVYVTSHIKKALTGFDPFFIPVVVIIFCVYVLLIYLQFRFPQNTSDSLYNHLSRIGHWLQQGSLGTYAGYNDVGTSYPYNNSLLMLWSVSLLRSDRIVGLVQFSALLMTGLTLYGFATELGCSKNASWKVSLFIFTFPIIVFESISAQNDILVASFLFISFYFAIKVLRKFEYTLLILSILSFSLSVGTKQSFLFALPGYFLIFLTIFLNNKKQLKRLFTTSVLTTVLFFVLVGGYSYIQNMFVFHHPAGGFQMWEANTHQSFLYKSKKAVVNTLRNGIQFLSCEALPPDIENGCMLIKSKALRLVPGLSRLVENNDFIAEEDKTYTFDMKYELNEDSSWYGLHGALLIFSGSIVMVVRIAKHRKKEDLLILVSAVIFFILTSSFKSGWDSYFGRFMFLSILLIMPYVGILFSSRNWLTRLYSTTISLIALFLMVYAITNNDSRPLVSKNQFTQLQLWGKNNSLMVQKLAYKLYPTLRHDYDVWNLDPIQVKTLSMGSFREGAYIVKDLVPNNTRLGLLFPMGFVPDYLFFGDDFSRKIIEYSAPEQLSDNRYDYDYLLVSPEFGSITLEHHKLVEMRYGWYVYQPIK